MMIGTVSLACGLADALREDAVFQAASQSAYGKQCLVEVGFDRRRLEWTKVCPFAVFAVGGTDFPEGIPIVKHDIGIVFGVNDRGFTTEFVGYDFLGEKAWPAAIACITNAIGSIPGLSIGEVKLEFNQESFPLLYLNAALTIHESLPVGRRI